MQNIIWFDNLRMTDILQVGGKNASLGEMISQLTDRNIRVPGGFATTADAYKKFLAQKNLKTKIDNALANLDVTNVLELAKIARQIQGWIIDTPFQKDLEIEIETAYSQMSTK
ncbi:MAG: phosphoenolpyruvate synthase, partial [Burkholderiales bacterium]|nr:phosphoenolpyruvate synthase [Burkholderiales bacterium]